MPRAAAGEQCGQGRAGVWGQTYGVRAAHDVDHLVGLEELGLEALRHAAQDADAHVRPPATLCNPRTQHRPRGYSAGRPLAKRVAGAQQRRGSDRPWQRRGCPGAPKCASRRCRGRRTSRERRRRRRPATRCACSRPAPSGPRRSRCRWCSSGSRTPQSARAVPRRCRRCCRGTAPPSPSAAASPWPPSYLP